MVRYTLRRIAISFGLLFLVNALVFAIFYLLPSGDPAVMRAGKNPSPEQIQTIRTNLGLDRSVLEQYWIYTKNLVFHLDFGYSYTSHAPVLDLIKDRLPATIAVAVGAVVVWLIIGLPVGILAAVRRGTVIDRSVIAASLVAISLPVFWLGLVGLSLFSTDIGTFPLLPGSGSYTPFSDGPLHWAGSLLLPWLVLAAGFAAVYARMVRASLIDTLNTDYVRTARAKGALPSRVVVVHALRAALTPVVSMLGLDIGVLLGGAVLVETVFNIPGVGRLSYQAIVQSDYAVIQGTVLFAAVFVLLANLVVDLAYAALDPRVRVR